MDDPRNHAAHEEVSAEECPRCEYTWDVLGLHEYGSWTPYDKNDLICPDCGRDLMEDD